ncbi:30S ribosomal protein S2 [Candidatus Dependentiae bacterium]|nr:30S ribosomal protein S2 [Candidatus Dependentiae bacterium]
MSLETKIDLQGMLKAGMHFGHKTSRWSPKMRPFIWGSKNKIHLIDISKTALLLERTGMVLKELASQGGQFLFVGTKKPAQALVKDISTSLSMPYVINRWVGGTLSNFDQVKKAITRLLHLRDVMKKPSALYKKKELAMIQKDIARLEKNIGGILELEYPPAALIVVDAKKEHSAVKEASRLGIPVIAMVDTNTDPDGITLVIPSNDDSPKAIAFVLEYLQKCIKEGVELFADKKKAEMEARRAAAEEAAKAKRTAAPVKASGPAAPAKAVHVSAPKTEAAPAAQVEDVKDVK